MKTRTVHEELLLAGRALNRACSKLTGQPALPLVESPAPMIERSAGHIAWPPRLVKAGDTSDCYGKAVLLPDFGLMFSAEAPLKATSWVEAKKLASECRLFGHTDWRLPEVHELELLIRRDRHKPAIDTEFFPHTPTDDWYWSATPYAPSPADYAWCVYFYYGSVLSHFQLGGGFVRPVRRVSSGQ